VVESEYDLHFHGPLIASSYAREEDAADPNHIVLCTEKVSLYFGGSEKQWPRSPSMKSNPCKDQV